MILTLRSQKSGRQRMNVVSHLVLERLGLPSKVNKPPVDRAHKRREFGQVSVMRAPLLDILPQEFD